MSMSSKALLVSAAALAMSVTGARAEIVCNDAGECWHAREHAEYKPELRLRVHPDDWQWGESERYRWREHEGRGYWRDDVWIDIK